MPPEPPLLSRRAVLRAAALLAATGGVPALAGCASSPSSRPDGRGGGLRPLPAVTPRQAVALRDVATDLAPVTTGMRAFGTALHAATADASTNWTASPLSVDVAFGMLRAGSRRATARELDQAFGFPADPHRALNALTRALVTVGPVSTATPTVHGGGTGTAPIVGLANGLFVDDRFRALVVHAFLAVLAAQYGVTPTTVSFADSSATGTINAWVAAQTRGRIRKLFDALDPSTRLVLANAVYLKAGWASPFEPTDTTDGAFHTADGRTVTALLMHQSFESVPYAARGGWQRITLAYVGDQLSMRVVVPTGRARTITDLAPALAAAVQPRTGDAAAPVELVLPRWDTATAIPLLTALHRLGVTDLNGARADFDGIAPGIEVTDAIHRATITVDERGTEAAAVTGIAMGTSASVGPPIVVRADRPFAWAIVHEPTGTPVFVGHVVDPTR